MIKKVSKKKFEQLLAQGYRTTNQIMEAYRKFDKFDINKDLKEINMKKDKG